MDAVSDRAGGMGTGLLVNIDVDDLEKAVAFYRDAFDLTVGRRFGDKAAEMLGSSAPIYLLEKPAGSPAFARDKQTRDYARHWTPIHLDFVVPDIRHAMDKAQAAGARIESDLRTEAWGHIALLSDPFGNGFCLIEFIGRGYDEIAR
jgi:predicted enzyme related to lactoylglutathione lyase